MMLLILYRMNFILTTNNFLLFTTSTNGEISKCSHDNSLDIIIDGFDAEEMLENECWEENGYLCHLLAIVIMTITVLLFV